MSQDLNCACRVSLIALPLPSEEDVLGRLCWSQKNEMHMELPQLTCILVSECDNKCFGVVGFAAVDDRWNYISFPHLTERSTQKINMLVLPTVVFLLLSTKGA